MTTFAKRLIQASAIEAATPRQLDTAASVMFNVFGQWDRQKSLGGSEGVLTWLAKNPGVKAFPGLKMVTLEYSGGLLSVQLQGGTGEHVLAEGKSWAHVRKDLLERSRATDSSTLKKAIQAIIKTRASV